jgi:regulator of PEP synthase PpsR (kinase-PPPase family)
MGHKHQISLISDFTGETPDKTFFVLKSQFSNFNYEKRTYFYNKRK